MAAARKKTGSKSTVTPDTKSADTATPDTATPDTGSDDTSDDQPDTGGQDEGDADELTDNQKLRLGRHHPVVEGAGQQLDDRPGEPRVCKAPHCGRKIEKRGLCGYHWATRRSIADPA